MWNLAVVGLFALYFLTNFGSSGYSDDEEIEDPIDEMIENGTYKFGPNYKE